jgi:hypothetical protein
VVQTLFSSQLSLKERSRKEKAMKRTKMMRTLVRVMEVLLLLFLVNNSPLVRLQSPPN